MNIKQTIKDYRDLRDSEYGSVQLMLDRIRFLGIDIKHKAENIEGLQGDIEGLHAACDAYAQLLYD